MEHQQKLSCRIESPVLSIVILTYNASHDLGLCLSSLLGQTVDMRSVQIVIVDDGSIDATEPVVSGFIGDLEIDYFVLKHTGVRGGNRNFGVSKARAERILFLDGDMILSPDFVAGHLRNTDGSRLAVSMGKRLRPFKADETRLTPELIRKNFEILENLPAVDDERLTYLIVLEELGLPHDKVFAMVFSHNFCLWKERFDAVGGFDERFSRFWGAEDVELGYRLVKSGCNVKLDSRIIGYHLFKNEDIQNKLRQLKKNLVLFREKHRDWEAELAAVEHLIWPSSYLPLRNQLLAGVHLTSASEIILDSTKRYLSFGVEFPDSAASSRTGPAPQVDAVWPNAIGLFPLPTGNYDEAFISAKYHILGEEFFERVLGNAKSVSRRVSLIDDWGRRTLLFTQNHSVPHKKKLIITLSDTNFGGKNKTTLYRLGIALSRKGVKVGFALAGDAFGNRNKFAAFGDIDYPPEQRDVLALYRHDLFLDEEIPNLMDGLLGGSAGRGVDRRLYWQESIAYAPEQTTLDEIKANYARLFARRSTDEHIARAAEAVIPMGVDAEGLRRLSAEFGERMPGAPITILWICPSLDDLSGIEQVLESFVKARSMRRNLALRIVVGSNTYGAKPEYFNHSSWHLVKKAHDFQLEKERRLIQVSLAGVKDRSGITILSGMFGDEFISREVMKSDIVLDTSPSRLLDPWILAAYAVNRNIVRFADKDYDDYFNKAKLFEFDYELVSGSLGGPQLEPLAHGMPSQVRYRLYKKAVARSLDTALIRAIDDCTSPRPRTTDEDFLSRFGWDEIAGRFTCYL